jgi:superfamily II helicase
MFQTTPGFCPEGEEVKKMEVNTNTKKRGPYLPRELRIKIYNDVIALRQQGRSYSEIRRTIKQKYEIRLSKSTIANGFEDYIVHITAEEYLR